MVDESFEAWLPTIGGLNLAQRSRALRALALAEAVDTLAGSPFAEGDSASHDAAGRAGAMSATRTQRAARDEGLLGKLRRDRIESFGCPHCSSAEVRPWGRAVSKPRYRFANCRKTLLHYKERWVDQAQVLIAGNTVSKAAERCRVAYNCLPLAPPFSGCTQSGQAAAPVRHRRGGRDVYSGILQGQARELLRAPRKRGGKVSKRGLSCEQIPVIVARDRSGATINAVLPHLDIASTTTALGRVITSGAELYCDGGKAISGFARRARVKTHVLAAPGGPKPHAPRFHINNVNAYHSRLKEWMRRFHGIATDNLPNYLTWRRTIEAFPSRATSDAWIRAAAGLGPYQQRST